MKTKAYSKRQLEAARTRTQEAHKDQPTSGKIGESGRMTMQVDQVAYMNAVDRNGGVDASGNTIWSDTQYRSDMMKRHPEMVIAADKAGTTIGPYTGAAAENFKSIFGEGKLDGVVSVPGNPFAHLKV